MTSPNRGRPPEEQEKDSRRDDLAWLATLLLLQHQDDQNRLAAIVVARMLPLWGLLDFRALSVSQRPWIDAVLPVVRDGYEQSQRLARQFVVDYRHAKRPELPELEALTGRRANSADVILDAAAESRSLAGDSIDRFDQVLRDTLVGTAEEPASVWDPQPGAAGAESTGNAAGSASEPGVERSGAETSRRGTSRAGTPGDIGTPSPESPLEGGRRSDRARVLLDTGFDVGRAAASLLGTGPGEVQKRMPAPEREAMEAGRLLSAKVATRITTDGGRAVVQRAVELDDEAIGWARVLNVNPCSFCALLASRGAAYKKDSFKNSDPRFLDGLIKGVAKVHDGCRCGMRPVYNAADFHDSTAIDLYVQWRSLPGAGMRRKSRSESSADHRRAQLNAFRRGFVMPDPPAAPRVDLHSLIATRARLLDGGLRETSDQVRWIDNQIARFGALIDTNYTPGASTSAADRAARADVRRARARVAATVPAADVSEYAETPAQVAARHLPPLRDSLENLLARGLAEDAPQVMWHRKQIARMSALL